jgi:Domain of unknown function (DUF4878)
MKKIFVAALAVCTLFVTSCGGAAGSDPKATLIAFFEAMGKKDFATAKKLATKDSDAMFSLMETAAKMGSDKDKKDMDFDKTKMEFGEAKIEGDKATVEVKDKASGEGTNFVLRKEDGSWKVAFNKSSMMEMGLEKAKEKGMDNLDADKLEESLDKLKNMNTDSLQKAISDGMKALDTVSKTLDKLKQ